MNPNSKREYVVAVLAGLAITACEKSGAQPEGEQQSLDNEQAAAQTASGVSDDEQAAAQTASEERQEQQQAQAVAAHEVASNHAKGDDKDGGGSCGPGSCG